MSPPTSVFDVQPEENQRRKGARGGFVGAFVRGARRGPHVSPIGKLGVGALIVVLTAGGVAGLGLLLRGTDKQSALVPTSGAAGAGSSLPAVSLSPSAQTRRVTNRPSQAPLPAPAQVVTVHAGQPEPAPATRARVTTTKPKTSATQVSAVTALIVSYSSGRCVDVVGGRAASGTPLQIWDCTGATWQRWTFTGGTVRSLGLCLTTAGASMANGTAVQVATCNGSTAQKWTVNGSSDLVNTVTGRCVDIRDAGTANGTRLQLWTCSGGSNQKWHLG